LTMVEISLSSLVLIVVVAMAHGFRHLSSNLGQISRSFKRFFSASS
jgi:hypothetical protein